MTVDLSEGKVTETREYPEVRKPVYKPTSEPGAAGENESLILVEKYHIDLTKSG